MNIDRRLIYLFVLIALLIPLQLNFTLPAVPMHSANLAFDVLNKIEFKQDEVAFVALDFGPSTMAENQPQAEALIEHLMRRRIPILIFSQYVLAVPTLRSLPEKVAKQLMQDYPKETWQYGKDWVNIGYRPSGSLFIQGIPKTKNLRDFLKTDDFGNNLTQLELTKNLINFSQIKLLVNVTGLRGILNTYIDFFQSAEHRPKFIHGCTSIAIPEAYIFIDSGQLAGLLEGIAGAAWYSNLLTKYYQRTNIDSAQRYNSMLAVAHLVIIFLIIAGNILDFIARRKS